MEDVALRTNQAGNGRRLMTGRHCWRWGVRSRNGRGGPTRHYRGPCRWWVLRSRGRALMRHFAEARSVACLPLRVQATTTFRPLVGTSCPSEGIAVCSSSALGPAVPSSVITATTHGKLAPQAIQAHSARRAVSTCGERSSREAGMSRL